MPAIAAVFSDGELFTSRELVTHPAQGPSLRGGLSTKQVGRLLTRADGITIGGFRVERLGSEINVALWSVVPSEPD